MDHEYDLPSDDELTRAYQADLKRQHEAEIAEKARKAEAERAEDRYDLQGQSYGEWWDEMHHQAQKASNGAEFKAAVERDHHLLGRDDEKNQITLHSAAGVYETVLNRSLLGDGRSYEEFKKYLSSIDLAKLPTAYEARQVNDADRVKEFWDLADKNALVYKSAIEGAGYVLAKRDNEIAVVTPGGVVDDLRRLTPAITSGGDDISDYRKFIAPIDVQNLPSVQEAQAMQVQKAGLDPELDTLLKNLSRRQAKEALDLADRQERQIHGDPPNWLTHRHLEEREEQKKDFAAERERYISEYGESRRLLDEIHGREKQEGLERGEDLEHGRGFSR